MFYRRKKRRAWRAVLSLVSPRQDKAGDTLGGHSLLSATANYTDASTHQRRGFS